MELQHPSCNSEGKTKEVFDELTACLDYWAVRQSWDHIDLIRE